MFTWKQYSLISCLNKNVTKDATYFSKALLRNATLFLLSFLENNFELNLTEHLQRMPQFRFTVKSLRIFPQIWRTIILDLLMFWAIERNLAYIKIYYHAIKKKKSLYKCRETWFIHFSVFSNSTEEKLKSKIYKAEKHLDSKRDPRLSSTVLICLSISLENSVMRGSPRSPNLSYILQGKVSPTLVAF